MELDALCLPSALYSDDDPDLIPDEMREAIKYGAARRVFQASQRYAQASVFHDQFMSALGLAVVARDRGKSRTYYPVS